MHAVVRTHGVCFDVLDPLIVRVDIITGEAEKLDTSFLELRGISGYFPQLGGADGSEVAGVGEDHGPGGVDEVVKGELAMRGLDFQVGKSVANGKPRHLHFSYNSEYFLWFCINGRHAVAACT